MPWLETGVRDQRIAFVTAVRRGTMTVTATCQTFGISRKTGYKWLAREAAAGSVTALVNRSRRPQHSPQRTEAAVTARVVALRQTYGWGGAKLAVLLRAEGLTVAPRTVDRIIARAGLTHAEAAPAPAVTRFTAAAPNDLWQLDAKGHYPLGPGRRCHPLTVIDDHSRFVVGLTALAALQREPVQAALRRSFECYGVPRAMLMDHGSPWWVNGAAGLTRLSVWLLQQDIRIVHGRIRHPQTQGKVERLHRTLGERLRWWGVPTTLAGFRAAFQAFLAEYNRERPHAALGLEPPIHHYHPSRRPYCARPRPWEYPPGAEVRRVAADGMLVYAGRRWVVSEALAGQQVACTPIGRSVLVSYRHMYVREWQLTTGYSQPLLRPTDLGR